MDKNGYAPSIMQDTVFEPCCYLCGANGALDKLDRHEIFGGPYREKSKRLGLWVLLCHHECHIFGPMAAHNNSTTALCLKRMAQRRAMEAYGWSTEDFIRELGKNYLED